MPSVLLFGISQKKQILPSNSESGKHPSSSRVVYEGITIVIDTVSITRAGSTELVQIRSRVTKNGFESEIVTEAEANGDLFSTVAQAVISAFQAV